MKTKFISLIAAALTGVLSLVSCAAKQTDDVVQLRIDLDRTVLPADTVGRAVVKICFDGLRLPRPEARPPVNLAIVIDRSGSMEGEKIARAREAALEAGHLRY
jgi:Ca-activated chloride channel family protein